MDGFSRIRRESGHVLVYIGAHIRIKADGGMIRRSRRSTAALYGCSLGPNASMCLLQSGHMGLRVRHSPSQAPCTSMRSVMHHLSSISSARLRKCVH